MKKNTILFKLLFYILFVLFIVSSYLFDFTSGKQIGHNFFDYSLHMLKVLPAIFILIGLFDVWIKRETIEKHFGKDAGPISFIWVFILAAPMAGGLLPALPIGHALYCKGARFTTVFAFLGAVSIGRVPMMLFETTFLGWRFSFFRLLLSIPLVILTSVILGHQFDKAGYKLSISNEESKNRKNLLKG